MIRQIIKINTDRCDGCGICITACDEGALQIIHGKAVLVKDDYCDGLGNCLPVCPQDAIRFEMREAAEFNEKAVEEHLKKNKKTTPISHTSQHYDIYEQFSMPTDENPLAAAILSQQEIAGPVKANRDFSQFETEEPRIIDRPEKVELKVDFIETSQLQSTDNVETTSNLNHTTQDELINTIKNAPASILFNIDTLNANLTNLDSELANLDAELENIDTELSQIDTQLDVEISHIDEEIATISNQMIAAENLLESTIIKSNNTIETPVMIEIETKENTETEMSIIQQEQINQQLDMQTPLGISTIPTIEKKQSMPKQLCTHTIQNTTKKTNPTKKIYGKTELRQWPVQMKLVPTKASYFEDAHLLIAADCSAFSYAAFHKKFMKNKAVLMACPKLDNCDYTSKITEILIENNIKSVTVVRMEVPCCSRMEKTVMDALKQTLEKTDKFLPWQSVVISTKGKILK